LPARRLLIVLAPAFVPLRPADRAAGEREGVDYRGGFRIWPVPPKPYTGSSLLVVAAVDLRIPYVDQAEPCLPYVDDADLRIPYIDQAQGGGPSPL
jgi:hypothetical protein